MYHKTHHGNSIGTIELVAAEVRTLLRLFDKINTVSDNQLDDEHIVWNMTYWDLQYNLVELEKVLVG